MLRFHEIIPDQHRHQDWPKGTLHASYAHAGIARRMEGDVAVFESHATGHHEFRSKNFWAYDLRPGLSAQAYLRQKTDPHKKPTACLPADGRPPQEQYHIIPLMGIVHRQREIPAELRDITGPGDALPVAMTVDALGNVFAPDDNYVLQPTGGLVHIIDAAAVTPADRARQRQLMRM